MTPGEVDVLFLLGTIAFSRRCLGVMAGAGIHPIDLIRRHETGDWGALSAVEWSQNDRAVRNGNEVIASQYRFGRGLSLWVVTDANRQLTRILLDDEY